MQPLIPANYICDKSTAERRYYVDKDSLWYEADGHRFDYPVNSVICEEMGFKQDLSIDNE